MYLERRAMDYMKLVRLLKRKMKKLKIQSIINIRIFLCRNVESDNFLACLNCRRFHKFNRCQTTFLNRLKGII